MYIYTSNFLWCLLLLGCSVTGAFRVNFHREDLDSSNHTVVLEIIQA